MEKGISKNNLLFFWNGLKTKLNNKVDKENGKGLSANDFTSNYKSMLDGLNYTIDQRINNKLLAAFPVGTIIESKNATSPTTYIGGIWELYGAGRVTVGHDSSDSDFNASGKSGGSKELQSHSHNASSYSAGSHGHSGTANSSGVHSHSVTIGKAGGHSHTQHSDTWMNDQYAWDGRVPSSSGFYAGAGKKTYYTGSAGEHIHNVTINSGGAHQHSLTISGAGDHTHQINVASAGTGNSGNLQPYITVYRWIRTA